MDFNPLETDINENVWKLLKDASLAIFTAFKKETDDLGVIRTYSVSDFSELSGNSVINCLLSSFEYEVEYPENMMNWKVKSVFGKKKDNVEKLFKKIFPDFILPSYTKSIQINPLKDITFVPRVDMKDYESQTLTIKDLNNIFKSRLKDEDSRLSFKFYLNKEEVAFKNTDINSGINLIENNTVIFTIKINVFLKSESDMVKFVTNSNVLCLPIYKQFIAKQLSSLQQYTDKPFNQMNNIPVYDVKAFDYTNKFIQLYEQGKIFWVPDCDLLYADYINNYNLMYNADSKTIKEGIPEGNINKVLYVDGVTKTLVYTDEQANICSFSFYGGELLGKDVPPKKPESFDNFMKIASLEFGLLNTSYENQILKIYENFSVLKINVLLKCENKYYLKLEYDRIKNVIPFYDKEPTLKLDKDLIKPPRFNLGRLPVIYNTFFTDFSKNKVLFDFDLSLRDTFFINHIYTLLANYIIKRAVILTNDTSILFEKLTTKGVNPFIIDEVTLPNLISVLKDGIIDYIKQLPKEVIILINPSIFSAENITNVKKELVGNKPAYRHLVIELLSKMDYDYFVYYQTTIINESSETVLCLKELFNVAKYRYMWSHSNFNIKLLGDGYSDFKTKEIVFYELEYENVPVKLGDNKLKFYAETLKKIAIDIINDENYHSLVEESDFNKRNWKINNYLYNRLSLPLNFINNPNDKDYVYVEQFDQEDSGLISDKVLFINQIIYAHTYGGLINNVKRNTVAGKIMIICKDHTTRQYLKEKISAYGNNDKIILEIADSFIASADYTDADVYIIYDTPFDSSYLNNIINAIQYQKLNGLYDYKKSYIYTLTYENTLETTILNDNLNYILSQGMNHNYNDLFYTDEKDFISQDISYQSIDALNALLYKKYTDSKDVIESYKEFIFNKFYATYTDADVIEVTTVVPTDDSFNPPLPDYFYPINEETFITDNGVKLDSVYTFNCLDFKGNPLYKENYKVEINDTVFTEYGNAVLKSVNDCFALVQLKDTQISLRKDKIFTALTQKLNPDFVKINDYMIKFIKNDEIVDNEAKEDECIELDAAIVDGFPTLLTFIQDKDNEKLSAFDFKCLKNISMANIINLNDANLILNTIKSYVSEDRFNYMRGVCLKFFNGEKIKLPQKNSFYNQFGETLTVSIIDGKLYFVFNSEAKYAGKIKNKMDIACMYIKTFTNLQDIRLEIYRINKFLTIVNINSLLEKLSRDSFKNLFEFKPFKS